VVARYGADIDRRYVVVGLGGLRIRAVCEGKAAIFECLVLPFVWSITGIHLKLAYPL